MAKVNSQGTGLVYCGYIGGSENESSEEIAIDSQGNAYVTGYTGSSESSFPVKVGPRLTFGGGTVYGDAFVAKINAQGTDLVYCGYIGGVGAERGYGIAVDDQAQACVTGYTQSDETTFPVVVGPDLSFNGESDCFVAKVNAQGSDFIFCGYVGGSGEDRGLGIDVNGRGDLFLAGYTYSDASTFPVVKGPDLTHNGTCDAFVARLDTAGTALIYCGYLGGGMGDFGYAVAVDQHDAAYLTGCTGSSEASFPVALGPGLVFKGGSYDAFVAKVNPQGAGFEYCGYIGGSEYDIGRGIAVDARGNAYVSGGAFSSAAQGFPVTFGPPLRGVQDGFVARVAFHGYGLDYCGFIGAEQIDCCVDIDVDGQGSAYVTGMTNTLGCTAFPKVVGPDLTENGNYDAFVGKIAYRTALSVSPDPLLAGQSATFSVANAAPNSSTWLLYTSDGLGSTPVPPLNTTIFLVNPRKAFGPTMTDGSGNVAWFTTVPAGAAGRTLWIQAVQFNEATNVWETWVQ